MAEKDLGLPGFALLCLILKPNYFPPIFVIMVVNCLIVNCQLINRGPTGFDRMCDHVCKHAGSWGESLKR